MKAPKNRITVARRDYIESVREYNTELKTFPGILWASTLYRSYRPMEAFTTTAENQRPPTVKF